MSSLHRRARSVLIALIVLALSAGVALAGRGVRPSTASTAAEPTTQADQDRDVDASENEDADAPDAEAPETPEAETQGADEETAAGTTADPANAPTGEHPDNHGKLVSEAAQALTPTAFDTHGAYVRSVAQANHGHDQAAAAAPKHRQKGSTH